MEKMITRSTNVFLRGLKLISVFVLVFPVVSKSQFRFIDPREAREHFNNQNYHAAINTYKKLIENNARVAEYKHKLGLCYLRSFIDKTMAISYLEEAYNLPEHDDEVKYDLGVAYTYIYEYDRAIEMLNEYKTTASEKNIAKADKAIENCHTGKELLKFPLKVKFENAGPRINSPFADYYPFITKNGSMLVYTSRRKENKGTDVEFDGYFASDIYLVYSNVEGWSNPKNLGSVNSIYDEEAVGLSDDGKTIYVYVDQVKSFGDIYKTTRSTTSTYTFGEISRLDKNVNSSFLETSASLSHDEQTLFFASDREGGEGGIDLWMSRRLPSPDKGDSDDDWDEWGLPQNLGPKINTEYNEDFPTLSYDNKTLYFSSNGLPGMGEYDLFKTTWDAEKNEFSAPQNLGYPINTPFDNRTISFTEDPRQAYISTLRKDGIGNLDIYKVTFSDEDNRPAIFLLELPTGDSINPFITEVNVSIYNKYDDLMGSYLPNPNNGRTVMALMPGTYKLEIDAPEYITHTQKLKVTDFHVRMVETKFKGKVESTVINY